MEGTDLPSFRNHWLPVILCLLVRPFKKMDHMIIGAAKYKMCLQLQEVENSARFPCGYLRIFLPQESLVFASISSTDQARPTHTMKYGLIYFQSIHYKCPSYKQILPE